MMDKHTSCTFDIVTVAMVAVSLNLVPNLSLYMYSKYNELQTPEFHCLPVGIIWYTRKGNQKVVCGPNLAHKFQPGPQNKMLK